MQKWLGLSASIILISFTPFLQKKNINIFLAGDSTISVKDTKTYPETGWGMPFVYFWDATVRVINKAKNGRSTSSFKSEGLWKSILDEAAEGDYIFIQFGHNDEVPAKKTFTPEYMFKNNLIQFIRESKSKGAIPILLTPVARRKFDSNGKIRETHEVYARIVRSVAQAQNIPLIDLDNEGQRLYQQMGSENSKQLFMHLQRGEHPNYPDGKTDDTHFNELGARKIAEIVLASIRKQIPELAGRIINPLSKK